MSKYTIYSKPSCGYCLQAKQLLEQNKLEFEYKQLGNHYSLQEFMELFPNARTFPMIVKDGEVIAEYSSVTEAAKSVDGIASKISAVCKGNRKIHAGFGWVYKE